MVMDNLSQGQSSNKRTLEGTSTPSSNSFSILNNAEILANTVAMGVDMKTDDFDSINILRNMEDVRNALHIKQNQQNVCSPIIESPLGIVTNLNSDEDGTDSDIDSFTIVTSKKTGILLSDSVFLGGNLPIIDTRKILVVEKKSQIQSKFKT